MHCHYRTCVLLVLVSCTVFVAGCLVISRAIETSLRLFTMFHVLFGLSTPPPGDVHTY